MGASNLFLFACITSCVTADMPIFGCSNPCSLNNGNTQQTLFVTVQPKQKFTVKLVASPNQDYDLIVRLPLQNSDLDITGNVHFNGWQNTYNPYWQVAEFTYFSGTAQNTNQVIFKNNGGSVAPVQIIWGSSYQLTALQIVALPIAMFQTHGPYWVQQGYFWIFLIVCAVLATVYAALAKVRLWQAVLVYAICAFSTVFCEKLYHAIVATTRVGDAPNTAYAIVVIALCAEGLPALFCMLFMRYGKCRPVPWAILGLIVAVGFLFLAGSGWFVGVGLLAVASFMRLLGRLF